MSDLGDKLVEIKRQKDEYILPENIRKNVTVYGVTGTLETGSGGGDIKLFETVEEMQQDTTVQEGDLAVVYREELTNVTAESEFDSCMFPNEVVLNEAFTDNIYGSFRAVDSSSSYFDGMVDMSSSGFRFNGYGESSEIRVEYESEDGITYTRTDGGEELQEFGVIIKWEDYGEGFNSVIGNFMKIGGNYFEGLYKYGSGIDDETLLGARITETTVEDLDGSDGYTNATYTYDVLDYVTCKKAINALNNTEYAGRDYNLLAYDRVSNKFRFYIVINNTGYQGCYVCYYDNDAVWRITLSNNGATASLNYLEYDETNGLSNLITVPVTDTRGIIQATGSCNTYSLDNIDIIAELEKSDGKSVLTRKYINARQIFTSTYISIEESPNFDHNVTKYFKANTQLDTTSDYVYRKTFYGKNGVEDGILTTNVSSLFSDMSAEIYAKIQQRYDDMTPQILENEDEIADYNLYFVPEKTDGTPLLDTSHMTNTGNLFTDCRNLTHIALLDTSNVTSMNNMFNGCYNLKAVPLLDTSNVTSMNGMFSYCQSLKSIPLFDMSNVTMTISMFYNCYGLYTIPQLNISSVTNMNGMFSGCVALSNESLNNILAMCTNSAMTSNKTLKYIGLSQTQATTCQSLSNWSAFTNAGWTTGY